MDTSLFTTKPGSETVATKPGKTVRDGQPRGKDKAPAVKSGRKVESVTKDVPVTVKDTKATAEEPTVTNDCSVTVKDTKATAEEPKVPDSTAEIIAPKVTEPKKPTKADLAKAIYDEAVKDPNVNRKDIIARFRKEAGLTTAGAQSYYYKFQQESGRVVNKGPTKMDKAREVFQALTKDGMGRKQIVASLITDVGLTKAGAQTYFQTLKRQANKPTE